METVPSVSYRIIMPLAVFPKNHNMREKEQQEYVCYKCNNFTTVDRAAFKRHLSQHKTMFYCSFCSNFKNVRKTKVVAHEQKYHSHLVEASRSSVLGGRGLDPLPINDQALQEAVDAFLPPLDPELAQGYAAAPEESATFQPDAVYSYAESTFTVPAHSTILTRHAKKYYVGQAVMQKRRRDGGSTKRGLRII